MRLNLVLGLAFWTFSAAAQTPLSPQSAAQPPCGCKTEKCKFYCQLGRLSPVVAPNFPQIGGGGWGTQEFHRPDLFDKNISDPSVTLDKAMRDWKQSVGDSALKPQTRP